MGEGCFTAFGGEKDEAGLSLLTKQLFPTVSQSLTSKCVSIQNQLNVTEHNVSAHSTIQQGFLGTSARRQHLIPSPYLLMFWLSLTNMNSLYLFLYLFGSYMDLWIYEIKTNICLGLEQRRGRWAGLKSVLVSSHHCHNTLRLRYS